MLPPPSAVMRSSLACGYAFRPGECGGIVVGADVYPAFVAGGIVHTASCTLAPLGFSLRLPLTAGVLEVAHQFFLLGVHSGDACR